MRLFGYLKRNPVAIFNSRQSLQHGVQLGKRKTVICFLCQSVDWADCLEILYNGELWYRGDDSTARV